MVWKKTIHAVCGRDNNNYYYFPKGKFKLFNSLFHSTYSCTLCFQFIWFLLPICLPCVICGTYEMRIYMLCCDTLRSRHSSCVAWLVYIHMYCVPIATLNQNKQSRLLYLGDAQIIMYTCTLCKCGEHMKSVIWSWDN